MAGDGTKLNLVCVEVARDGDAYLAWRGWTVADDEDVVTHHFIGTMAISEVPRRVNLHVEMSHAADVTGDEPVPDDVPITFEIAGTPSTEFRFETLSEGKDLDDVFRVDEAAMQRGPYAATCFALHDGVGPILRVGGMALLGWHLLTNEWRVGNAEPDDPSSIATKPWAPAQDGEVVELSQVTAVTATVTDRLTIRGESVSDMYAVDRPQLMSDEKVLTLLTHGPPGEF